MTTPRSPNTTAAADLPRTVAAYTFFYAAVSGAAIIKGNSAIGLAPNKVLGISDWCHRSTSTWSVDWRRSWRGTEPAGGQPPQGDDIQSVERSIRRMDMSLLCRWPKVQKMGKWEHQMEFGVTTPGGPCAIEQLADVTELMGSAPRYLLWYQDFASAPPKDELCAVRESGMCPIITWEPWTGADRGPDTMCRLVAGALDEYVHEWITALRDWQRPVYLRFAHEFNGDWYPWSPAGGTEPGAYVSAWRRVHDIGTDAAATNVQWMWCADAGGPHRNPLAAWYPGDEFVDCFGVDGYNWGTTRPGTTWREAADIFADALAQMRPLTSGRPVLISEVGCAELGGSKPNWIICFVDYVRNHPDVRGFIWFDHDKETDWRIGSTPESAAAMCTALGGRR